MVAMPSMKPEVIKKKIHNEEKEIIKWARESVVSTDNIKVGEILTPYNISVKRPAPKIDEISASEYFRIVNKKAKVKIAKNIKLKWSHIK